MLEIQSKRVSKETTWSTIIAQRQSSGMTISTFCKVHGLKDHTFQYWQKKLSRGGLTDRKPEARFVAMELKDRASLVNRADSPAQKARIILPNGVQVDLGGGLDAATVRQFLQNLCGVSGARS